MLSFSVSLLFDRAAFGTIMEAAEEHEVSPVSDACHQLSEGLLAMSARDAVISTPATVALSPASPAASVTFASSQPLPRYVGATAMSQSVASSHTAHAASQHTSYNMVTQPVGSAFVVQQQQLLLNPVVVDHTGQYSSFIHSFMHLNESTWPIQTHNRSVEEKQK